MDFRRLVEAGGRKLDTGEIGLLDEIREGHFVLADAHPVRQEDDCSADTLHFSAAKATRRSFSWRAASWAAMPLRSEPEEAAVAEVFGTLAVVVAVIFTLVDIDLEAVGQNLRHLGIEALAHLGAAMVQVDRAVRDRHGRGRRPG